MDFFAMQPKERAYLSPNIEKLLEIFKKNILENLHSPVLQIVFVPNLAIKSFLLKSLATDPRFTIAAKIKFFLSSHFTKMLQHEPLSSPLEIEAALYVVIKNLLEKKENLPEKEKALCLSLFAYLQNKETQEESICFLARQLQKCFSLYFSMGLEEKTVKNFSSWQQYLLYLLIYERGIIFPTKEYFSKNSLQWMENARLSFFLIPSFPLLFSKILENFPIGSQVIHYLFSPSRVYYEDLISDYEKKRLLAFYKKQKVNELEVLQWQEYVEECNRFLANFCKYGQKHLQLLSERNVFIEDDQQENEGLQQPQPMKTFLQICQNDILDNNFGTRKISKADVDDSIEIHVAMDKERELQRLYQYLLGKLQNEQLLFSDIQVMVPNMKSYLPYIESVFGASDSLIPYKISNYLLRNTHFFQALNDLVSLMHSRWEFEEVFALFENPAFFKKMKLTLEEVRKVKTFLQKVNVHEGIQEDFLNKKFFTFSKGEKDHSFLDGWERLIKKMVYYQRTSLLQDLHISLTDTQLIDAFFSTLLNLYHDLQAFALPKSLEKWRKQTESLVENYLSFTFEQKESQQIQDAYENFLQDLVEASTKTKEELFSGEAFLFFLKNFLDKTQTKGHLSECSSVHFGPYTSMHSCKILCLLGLDEDFPPKKETFFSLIENFSFKDLPSEIEMMHYYFLQGFLVCKENFYASFASFSFNGEKKSSSFLLKKFLSYLDETYLLEGKKVSELICTQGSFFPFDEENFLNNTICSSPLYYEVAKQRRKIFPKPSFFIKREPHPCEGIVDIQHLFALAKNPIEFFCKTVLKMKIEEKWEENPLKINPLDAYKIRNSLFEGKEFMKNLLLEGFFPPGDLQTIAFGEIEKEKEAIDKFLKDHALDKEEVFEIELKEGIVERVKKGNTLFFPPLSLEMDDKKVFLVGKITSVCPKGLILPGDHKNSSLCKAWPKILLLSCLSKFEGGINLYFLKSQKMRKMEISSPLKTLQGFLRYYFASKSSPSPFVESWAEAIFQKDEPSLQKKIFGINNQFFSYLDPYSKWVFSQFLLPEAKEIIQNWSSVIEEAFFPVFEDK